MKEGWSISRGRSNHCQGVKCLFPLPVLCAMEVSAHTCVYVLQCCVLCQRTLRTGPVHVCSFVAPDIVPSFCRASAQITVHRGDVPSVLAAWMQVHTGSV